MKLEEFAQAFREAAPYIHHLHGKMVVLAVSSSVIKSGNFSKLVEDVALMNRLGVKLMVLYGIRAFLEDEKDVAKIYHRDRRVTDRKTLERVKEISGRILCEFESRLSSVWTGLGGESHTIGVASGNFVQAKPLGVIDGVDMGYSGSVRNFHKERIANELDSGSIVILKPLGYSVGGEAYNISMPELASDLAITMGAEKLVFLNKEEGVLDANGEVVGNVTISDFEEKTKNPQGPAVERLYPYIKNALNHGVKRVQIVSGLRDGALFGELFTQKGEGTSFKLDAFSHVRKAGVEDIPSILRLIEPLVSAGNLIGRDFEYLENHIGEFSLLHYDDVLVGAAALKRFKDDPKVAELATLVVDEKKRKRGHGDTLFEWVRRRAVEEGVETLYALTTKTEDWFRERGFKEANFEELPKERREEYKANRRNSKVFRLDLRGGANEGGKMPQ